MNRFDPPLVSPAVLRQTVRSVARAEAGPTGSGAGKPRTRRVFGRVRTMCPASGKPVWIELTREGLRVRAYRARKASVLALADLITLARGQGVFRL